MHECENCGQACYCDMDDIPCPAPDDCSCPCWDGPERDFEPLEDNRSCVEASFHDYELVPEEPQR